MNVSLDRYIVKRNGEILDKYKANTPIKQFKSNNYLECCIHDSKGKHKIGVHIVVAKTYCDDWFEGCVVHHKDHNPLNNCADNLKCMTKAEHTKMHFSKLADKIMICPVCGKEFVWSKKAQRSFKKRKRTKTNAPVCSKHCAGKKSGSHFVKRKVRCVETNVIFDSCTQASKEMNIFCGLISDVARGVGKSTHGYHFEYV